MLSEEKKSEIRAEYAFLKSYAKVAKKCKVGTSSVERVVRNENRKLGKPLGRSLKINKRQIRQIKRHVTSEIHFNHRVTARSINISLDLNISIRSIQRVLKKNNMLYRIVKKKLPLTKIHRQNRINFARRHILAQTDFSKWIFSDEKRFSLDGPDNMGSYCTENAELNRIKRQLNGKSLTILGAISSKGNLFIKVNFWSKIKIQ